MLTRAILWLALSATLCQAQPQQPAGGAAPAPAWERFTYPGEEFSAEWPGMPYVYHARRVIRWQPYDDESMRYYGFYSGGAVMMVTAYDRPRRHETLKHLAKSFAEGHGRVMGARLTGEAAAGQRRGLELRSTSNFHGAARVFLTDRHAYVVHAFAMSEKHPSVARFLDSFALAQGDPPGRLVEDEVLPAALDQWPPPPRPEGAAGRPAPDAHEAGKLSDPPHRQAETTRRAVLVFKPEPGFTEEARRNNVAGMVRLRAVLSSDGRVKNISVVKGLPDGLTANAVRAARAVLFFPAEKDGRPVSQWVTFEYNFNIY